ncbi:MAG: bifunctional methylenetetrahydrofolate dehydrogenase/methenyltetrahydrofolate cyclohydrolase FolD [Mariprofundaceae bacterium]
MPVYPHKPSCDNPRMGGARILDGKAVSSRMRHELRLEVEELHQTYGRAPGLAVVLVGKDAPSQVYVRNKKRACAEIAMHSSAYDLPNATSQSELLELIARLNEDALVDGILVQLPLPAHIDAEVVIEAIVIDKDVDGFHPYNIGRLALRMPKLRPCTPHGCMKLLQETGCDLYGMNACIVGASNIVGRPMALELLLAGATPTIVHRFSQDIAAHISRADIVIAAAGKPGLVKGEWIKPGAIVLDVGITRDSHGKLVGDVEFEPARMRASWITPVPGGVGPMTITMLLANTVQAFRTHTGANQ